MAYCAIKPAYFRFMYCTRRPISQMVYKLIIQIAQKYILLWQQKYWSDQGAFLHIP